MRTALKYMLLAATIATSGVAVTAPANAGVYVSIDAGDVAFAYRDGWWDRDHRWHYWRDRDEWREYRGGRYARYYDYDHDRYGDGWYDGDWHRWHDRGEHRGWREHGWHDREYDRDDD